MAERVRRATAGDIRRALDTLEPGKPIPRQPKTVTQKQEFFGSYQIINEIGEGGAARVVRARHIHPNYAERTFALKLLFPQADSDSDMQTVFRKEAFLMALLKHPNIVRTFEAGVEEGQPFIAMEYISGRDLWEVLERADQLDVELRQSVLMHILGEVLRGIVFAHELVDGDGNALNVIHHDVNPTNIFLSFDGDVKLGDFGVAAVTQSGRAYGDENQGKLGYFAPEQFIKAPLDQRVDIFAFGVTMFELLCGVTPFESDDADEVLRLNREAIVPPPRRLNPGIDHGLAAVMMRALARKPNDRYGTARIMLTALEPFLPPRSGMKLAVAAYMRTLLLPEYVQELRIRQGLSGAGKEAGVGNSVAFYSTVPAVWHRWRDTLRDRGLKPKLFPILDELGDMLASENPDVLVVDVDGSDFSPARLITALANAPRAVPIVAATVEVTPTTAARARAIGAADLVYEPLRGERVQTAIWVAVKSGGGPQFQSGEAPAEERRTRVLFVTRDVALEERLSAALPQWGYEVDSTDSIAAALDRTRVATHHAVIFDVFPELTPSHRAFPEEFRSCEGIGMVPVLFLAPNEDHARLTGITRSAARARDESPVVLATTLNQLRSDVRAGRSFIRFAAAFEVEIRYGGRTFAAAAADVSRGGILVRCEEIPPVGTDLRLRLRLPGGAGVVEVSGRVVRILLPKDPKDRPGVGIEFAGFGVRNESSLIQFLFQLARMADAKAR